MSKTQTPNVKRVQQVVDLLFDLLPNLNRIHYHCYSYHLIAQRDGTAERWPRPLSAVAAGSLRATLRACRVSDVAALHGKQLVLGVTGVKVTDPVTKEDRTLEMSKDSPVAEFASAKVRFWLAPVVACAVPRQTVGLGDYISATALQKQL